MSVNERDGKLCGNVAGSLKFVIVEGANSSVKKKPDMWSSVVRGPGPVVVVKSGPTYEYCITAASAPAIETSVSTVHARAARICVIEVTPR